MQIKIYFPCVCALTDLCVKELQRNKNSEPGITNQQYKTLPVSSPHLLIFLTQERHKFHTGTAGPMELQGFPGLCCKDQCVTCQDLHSCLEQPFLLQLSPGAKEAGGQAVLFLVHWSSSAGPHAPWVLWLCAYQCAQSCQEAVLLQWQSLNHK